MKVGGTDILFFHIFSYMLSLTLLSSLIFTSHLSLPFVYLPVVNINLATKKGEIVGNPKR